MTRERPRTSRVQVFHKTTRKDFSWDSHGTWEPEGQPESVRHKATGSQEVWFRDRAVGTRRLLFETGLPPLRLAPETCLERTASVSLVR